MRKEVVSDGEMIIMEYILTQNSFMKPILIIILFLFNSYGFSQSNDTLNPDYALENLKGKLYSLE